ncbi:MAG: fibronectin type III domain-containing protein [Syntrophobacteraceae bacterium]
MSHLEITSVEAAEPKQKVKIVELCKVNRTGGNSMAKKTMTITILAIFLMVSVSWAFSGGGGAGVPIDLLMPSPPRNVKAAAGDGVATVSFDPPKTDAGSPVTVYTVTSHPAGIRAKGPKSPILVKGLTNGRTYTFTVTAGNSVGTGLASEACNSVTPKAE